MRHILILALFVLIYCSIAEAQTYANAPGPENVLVVWNSNSLVSDSVKNYYRDARGIPSSNIVPLNLPDTTITVDGVTHLVKLVEGGNIIRDSVNHAIQTWFATQHAWKYFYQYVAEPIKDHLVSNNLTETIRYIVLCKGTPFKIQAAVDGAWAICNMAVDGLLCILGTDNYDVLLDSIYSKYRRYAIDGTHYYYSSQMQITNPYFDADPNLNMNNRFNPGVFTRSWNGHTIKLDYLVSHLDGISYDMVEGIIDLSTEAIHSDNYDWFIDADPTPCHGGSVMVNEANATASKLNSIGFSNYYFDITEDTVTYHNKPVMSYSSNGVHTTIAGQNPFPADYIQSILNFNYAPGAI